MSHHERNNTKDTNKADRRLALLALAGERPESAGPCPEAETLAALVENRLTAPEADACLAHIAGCESCYALWLQVDREWRAQRRDGKGKTALLRLLGRPRALPVVGSLLAAAASIALVLTLTTQADRARLPYPAATPVPEQHAPVKPSAADSAIPQAKPAPARQDRTPPAGQPQAALRERAKTGRATADEERKTEDGRQAAPPAAMAAKERDTKKQAMAAPLAEMDSDRQAAGAIRQQRQAAPLPAAESPPPPQPMRARTPVTAEEWYRSIRQGCQGEPPADFFTAIAAQGRQLSRESTTLSGQDRQRIERIVAELGTKAPPAAGRCPALLELLRSTDQGPHR